MTRLLLLLAFLAAPALATACATVSYRVGAVRYTPEVFASAADQPGALTVVAHLESAGRASEAWLTADRAGPYRIRLARGEVRELALAAGVRTAVPLGPP